MKNEWKRWKPHWIQPKYRFWQIEWWITTQPQNRNQSGRNQFLNGKTGCGVSEVCFGLGDRWNVRIWGRLRMNSLGSHHSSKFRTARSTWLFCDDFTILAERKTGLKEGENWTVDGNVPFLTRELPEKNQIYLWGKLRTPNRWWASGLLGSKLSWSDKPKSPENVIERNKENVWIH